jgi:hypothetical protein
MSEFKRGDKVYYLLSHLVQMTRYYGTVVSTGHGLANDVCVDFGVSSPYGIRMWYVDPNNLKKVTE